MFDVAQYQSEIALLCGRFGIKRLEFFGSAVTDLFDDGSDIDCLIEFEKNGGSLFHRFFDFKYALEDLLGREVDLVVDSAIENPYFRKSVDATKQLVYAA